MNSEEGLNSVEFIGKLEEILKENDQSEIENAKTFLKNYFPHNIPIKKQEAFEAALILGNIRLISRITSFSETSKKNIILNGSNLQSFEVDKINFDSQKEKYPLFPSHSVVTIMEIFTKILAAQNKTFALYPTTLSDIGNGRAEGYNFKKMKSYYDGTMNNDEKKYFDDNKCDGFLEESKDKSLLIYVQIHKIAAHSALSDEKPTIHFDFYDDDSNNVIIDPLRDFFGAHDDLIPRNMFFSVFKYNGDFFKKDNQNRISPHFVKQGRGKINFEYRKILRDIYQKEGREDVMNFQEQQVFKYQSAQSSLQKYLTQNVMPIFLKYQDILTLVDKTTKLLNQQEEKSLFGFLAKISASSSFESNTQKKYPYEQKALETLRDLLSQIITKNKADGFTIRGDQLLYNIYQNIIQQEEQDSQIHFEALFSSPRIRSVIDAMEFCAKKNKNLLGISFM